MAYFPFQGHHVLYRPKVLYATQRCAGDQEEREAEKNILLPLPGVHKVKELTAIQNINAGPEDGKRTT